MRLGRLSARLSSLPSAWRSGRPSSILLLLEVPMAFVWRHSEVAFCLSWNSHARGHVTQDRFAQPPERWHDGTHDAKAFAMRLYGTFCTLREQLAQDRDDDTCS